MIKEKYIVFRVMIRDDGKIACLARDCFDKFKDAKKFLKKYHKGKRLKVCNRLYTIDCVGVATSDCNDVIFFSLSSEYSKRYTMAFLEQGE